MIAHMIIFVGGPPRLNAVDHPARPEHVTLVCCFRFPLSRSWIGNYALLYSHESAKASRVPTAEYRQSIDSGLLEVVPKDPS